MTDIWTEVRVQRRFTAGHSSGVENGTKTFHLCWSRLSCWQTCGGMVWSFCTFPQTALLYAGLWAENRIVWLQYKSMMQSSLLLHTLNTNLQSGWCTDLLLRSGLNWAARSWPEKCFCRMKALIQPQSSDLACFIDQLYWTLLVSYISAAGHS